MIYSPQLTLPSLHHSPQLALPPFSITLLPISLISQSLLFYFMLVLQSGPTFIYPFLLVLHAHFYFIFQLLIISHFLFDSFIPQLEHFLIFFRLPVLAILPNYLIFLHFRHFLRFLHYSWTQFIYSQQEPSY